jgi:hypothetical protein
VGGEQGGVLAGPAAKIHRPLPTTHWHYRCQVLVELRADQFGEPVEVCGDLVERAGHGGQPRSPMAGSM